MSNEAERIVPTPSAPSPVAEPRPFQFHVSHLLLALLIVALMSGIVHNYQPVLGTAALVLLSSSAPAFVLLFVVAMAIRPIFSFPWKLTSHEGRWENDGDEAHS